jgi:hypothetical protein
MPYLLATLALLAALIHAMVLPGHMAEMWQHGVFMLAAAVGQATDAALRFALGARYPLWARRLSLAGNGLLVLMAVWAYTLGLPPFLFGDGVEANNWQVDACVLAEALLIAATLRGWPRAACVAGRISYTGARASA